MLTITHPIQLVPREGHEANAEVGTGQVETKEESSEAVSYTHLTLPTKLSV